MMIRLLVVAGLIAVFGTSCAFGKNSAAKPSTPPNSGKETSPKSAKKKYERNLIFRVEYHLTGGIAGVNKVANLDSKTMPKADAEKLSQLLQDCGILEFSSKKHTNPFVKDPFRYQVYVYDRNGRHRIVYDDATMPPQFRPLVDFLNKRAVEEK